MPLLQFCQKCGLPTSYSSTKPKECSKCGSSFETSISYVEPTEKKLSDTENVLVRDNPPNDYVMTASKEGKLDSSNDLKRLAENRDKNLYNPPPMGKRNLDNTSPIVEYKNKENDRNPYETLASLGVELLSEEELLENEEMYKKEVFNTSEIGKEIKKGLSLKSDSAKKSKKS